MEIRIRSAAESDASLLAELQVATFHSAYIEQHTREDLDAYCAQNYTDRHAIKTLSSNAHLCSFGMLDQELAGYYILSRPDGGGLPELKQIYVLPFAYGKGLAQALFYDALAEVENMGVTGLDLCVSDLNIRARSFYEKLGFARSASGPVLKVGNDRLKSSILTYKLKATPEGDLHGQ